MAQCPAKREKIVRFVASSILGRSIRSEHIYTLSICIWVVSAGVCLLQNGLLLSQAMVGMLEAKFFDVDSRQNLSRTYFPKSIIQERHVLNGITSQKFGAGTRRSLAIQVGDLDFLGHKIHSLSASRGCAPSTQPNPLFKPPVTMLLTTSLLRTLWSSELG